MSLSFLWDGESRGCPDQSRNSSGFAPNAHWTLNTIKSPGKAELINLPVAHTASDREGLPRETPRASGCRNRSARTAAGFTVQNDHLDELVERLRAIAWRELHQKKLQPVFRADAVTDLRDLQMDLINFLSLIQPTGVGNPPVLFVTPNLKVTRAWTVGRDSAHLRLKVTDGRITSDAIAFRFGRLANSLPALIDLVYSFEINEYNGEKSFQLNVKDIRSANS